MADLFKTATDFLHDQQKEHLSTSVNYARGATSATVSAVVMATRTETVDDEGGSYKVERRDFGIHAADLSAVSLFPPQRGDVITVGTRTYEVLPRAANEGVWRWSDRHHKAVRIFAKSRSST